MHKVNDFLSYFPFFQTCLNPTTYNSVPLTKPLLDPSIYENALEILAISNEDAKDSKKLDSKFLILTKDLNDRKIKTSPLIADLIKKLIDNVESAYETIKRTQKQVDNAMTITTLRESSLLKTPLDVYLYTLKHFPDCSAEEIRDPSGSKLKLNLSSEIDPLFLEKTIDTQEFYKKIHEVFRNFQMNRLCSLEKRVSFSMDPRDFSIMQPLSEWKLFRRVFYEKQGHSCVDVIIDYLRDSSSSQPELLASLGFAPADVSQDVTEKDLSYFKEAFYKIQGGVGDQQKKSIIDKFYREYPTVFNLILDEVADQELKQELQEGEDFYQASLRVLRESVYGQSHAVEKMATSLASQENQAANKVFLFVGPTGVGKTELAKAVSKVKENRFIMIPMNQYQHDSDISKLFGSSAGYVGSTDKPHLAKEFERYKPVKIRTEGSTQFYELRNVVILFDEFEKAHSCVKQSLLTLFDEGFCKVSYTSGGSNLTIQYNLKGCIIINTSNLYQQQILCAFIESQPPQEISELFKRLNLIERLPTSYSPELLGRMVVVPFSPIPKGQCYQSLIKAKFSNFLVNLKSEIGCREISIEYEGHIFSSLEEKLYGEGTDIRRVSRYFDDIKGMIYQNKRQWGKLETKKIVFSFEQGRPIIRLMTYLDIIQAYHDTPVSKLPFP